MGTVVFADGARGGGFKLKISGKTKKNNPAMTNLMGISTKKGFQRIEFVAFLFSAHQPCQTIQRV